MGLKLRNAFTDILFANFVGRNFVEQQELDKC